MINLKRETTAPASLAGRTSYRKSDVLEALDRICYGKCYLCEGRDLTAVNVEHVIPHEGDEDLKFCWGNLLLACYHCNNTKGAQEKFHPIHDCCDDSTSIIDSIRISYEPFPLEHPRFDPADESNATKKTVSLLDAIFSGTTLQKKLEANSLRNALLDEMTEFLLQMQKYFRQSTSESQKEKALAEIESHLSPGSAFCAFKIWAIRSKPRLDEEFGHFYRSHQPCS